MTRTSWVATVALAVLSCASLAGFPARAAAIDPREIPLVDQNGDSFRLSDLRGRVTFVTFVATRCSDSCPLADGQFARLEAKLAGDRVSATLVTITLDPAYDTPFVMANFARPFGRRADWRFASGRPANVRAIQRALGVDVERRGGAVTERHSAFVYVLDRDVRLARTLLLSDRLSSQGESVARAIDARS